VSEGPLQIAIIGKGAVDEELAPLAEEVGRRLVEAGAVVVCGGHGGVMEAAARGAREAGGDVIGILPGEDPAAASPHCTHVVATGVGHARNLAVVASAQAVIAIGGEWGTLAEIAFARRLGRPVIALRSWSLDAAAPIAREAAIEAATDPAQAVASALAFAAAAR